MPLSIIKKWLIAVCILSTTFFSAHVQGQIITTIAGGIGETYGAATAGRLYSPQSVTVDAAGNLYIAENGSTGGPSRFRKVTPAGIISSVAGNGITSGYTCFGKPAVNAQTTRPQGITIDAAGNILLSYAFFVSKVDASGTLWRVAGNGANGFSGDGSISSTASLNTPYGIATDAGGNIYIADRSNNRIRKINASGIITTVAGGGSVIGDGGPANAANLGQPNGVAVDASGNIYIADRNNDRIRKVNTSGIISTIATPNDPHDVKVDAAGNIYYSAASAVWKINTTMVITKVAGGTGSGFAGDGGPATAATLNNAAGIALDVAGNLYIADEGNNRVRKVNTSGIISTVAGNGLPLLGFSGDGGPAELAVLGKGTGSVATLNIGGSGGWLPSVAVNHKGNIFIADANNHRIRKIDSFGIIRTIAGTGIAGYFGDGGPATTAQLNTPASIAFDKRGNLYFADYGSHHIRKIDTVGIITTIAGGGFSGLGDGGPATAAIISVASLCLDSLGNVFLVDIDSQRIRKIDVLTGIIKTVAGNGIAGYSGDGGPATLAKLNTPFGVSVDQYGNIYVSDGYNSRIRKIDQTGIISTIAGGLVYAGTTEENLGDNGPATAAGIVLPTGILADKYGNIYFSDWGRGPSNVYDSFRSGYSRVRQIDKYGYIRTVAGNGIVGYSGDGGNPALAEFERPWGLAIDSTNHLYIADNGNYAIRKACCITNPTDHPPLFTGGPLQTMTVCMNTSLNPINTVMTISDADAGDTESWTVMQPPAHGILGGFTFSSISTGSTLVPSGMTYTPTPGFFGTDTFKIKIHDGDIYNTTVIAVSVDPLPAIGIISGATSVCIGTPSMLSDNISGGIWSSSNTTIATVNTSGQVTPLTSGIATISYTKTSSCGSASATYTITVSPTPPNITGTVAVCVLATTTLSNALAGGTWASSNITIANVNANTGVVTGVSAGTPNITYMMPSGCSRITPVTVNALATAGTISGPAVVCVAAQITLANAVSGGTWTASNGRATVSGGVVTGVSAGAVTITYTVANGCGSAFTTYNMTVNPLANPGTISGPSAVCVGSLITLSSGVSGGVWSSSDPYVFVGATGGIIAGLATGTATINYLVTNSCGTATATATVSVTSNPYPGVITGNTSICTGGTTDLSNAVTGGVWSSANTFVATITGSGVVTGVAVGSAVLSYTVFNSCGSSSTIGIVNVTASTPIMPITGPSSVCTGLNITLNNGSPGGVWTSSNPTVATISNTGVVTGLTAGVTAISYTASLGCGVSIASTNVTVNSSVSAGSISGSSVLCTGATALLTNFIPGGTWTAVNGFASVTGTGVVTGISPGTETVTYTVTNGCGTAATTLNINVFPAPVAGTITGPASVCASNSITLANATPGGVWSSNNTLLATVSNTGSVTGIAAGSAVISYTTTTGCGTANAVRSIAINVPFAGFVTGVTTLCAGNTSSLNSSVPGGVWSISSPTVATISNTGFVTALAAGTAIISYTATGSCGPAISTAILTVGTLPIVSPITGITNICTSTSTPLADATIGGVWSSSNPGVAAVSSTGMVTGLSAGTASISYMVTAGCGTAGVTAFFTVDAPANPGTISGSPTVCQGTTSILSDDVAGGTWSSSNTSVGTIDNVTRIVSGVATGSFNAYYTVTNICGSATATYPMAVNPLPVSGTISGSAAVCAGTSATLSSTVAGGVWSSANAAIATVAAGTGIVTGNTAGNTNVMYSVTNSCGTAGTIQSILVNPLPNAGTISGLSAVCTGASIPLSNNIAGGVWGSTVPGVASISNSGTVTGIAPGTASVLYSVTNICGTATTSATVTVNTTNAGTITGITSACGGGTTTLFNAVTGGTWSSGNTSVATISATGVVSAIAPGSTIIAYAATNSCGTATTTALYTVGSLPLVSPITGGANICIGSTLQLADATTGGSWSSSNTAVATVSNTGVVTGIAAGTYTISYSVTAGCGTSVVTATMNIETTPVAGTISGNDTLCKGTTTAFAPSIAGGVWSSSNNTIAVVGNTGAVTGVNTGSATISYAVTNSCSTTAATRAIHIISAPDAGSVIASATNICTGATCMLSDAIAGGIWRSGAAAIATVTETGTVTGVSPGSVVISYTLANSCGANSAVTTVNVSALPYILPINGPASVPTGSTATFTDPVSGGTWNISDISVASIDRGGIVTGIAEGTATVTYTIINSFGCIAYDTAIITVTPAVNTSQTIKIYPNPAKEVLHIEAPQKVNIQVFSADGRLMLTQPDAVDIDVHYFPKGVYLIQVFNSNNSLLQVNKFVKD